MSSASLRAVFQSIRDAIKQGVNKQSVGGIAPADFAAHLVLEQPQAVTPSSLQQIIKPSQSGFGLKQVTVNAVNAVSKTITQNGAFTPSPGEYWNAISVNVPNPSTGSINITKNGTYNVTDKASAVVAVQQTVKTATANATSNSITFQELTGEPEWFVITGSFDYIGSSSDYITTVFCRDGEKEVITVGAVNSNVYAQRRTKRFGYEYRSLGGQLIITVDGSALFGFRDAAEYKLVYGYHSIRSIQ